MTNHTPPLTPGSEEKKDSQDITVMLVDDSSVIRSALKKLIDGDPDIEVIASVPNGELAVGAANRKKPDVVILDIEMPIMDGLTALPKILEASPQSKVVMFSSLTESGASVSIKALSLGAVECLAKPSSAAAVGEGSEFQRSLLTLIKGFFPNRQPPSQRVRSAVASSTATSAPSLLSGSFDLKKDPMAYTGKPDIVAIGSSTGGPEALFEVTKSFKDFDVPIILTQHMPATFTKMLATHIQQKAGITAFEAEDGMPIEKGNIYVAPGGYHFLLDDSSGILKAKLDEGPAENFCKPAVDVMIRSAIDLAGRKVLGVILTGMGQDGLLGMEKLVQAGGRLIAQDEPTSIVWGMPGAVAKAGLCTEVLPLQEIGPWIRKAVLG